MTIEPARHGFDERSLEIEGWFVASDPILPESLEHRTDVLMFVFDGAARPAEYCGVSVAMLLRMRATHSTGMPSALRV